MKKLNTEFIDDKEADLVEVKRILNDLVSEVWICLYDSSKKNPNYIQAHSDIEYYEDDALAFLNKVLSISPKEFQELGQIYLVEYRRYEDKDKFKHYRAFFPVSHKIYSYFEKYMNNEDIDTDDWIDVTNEFD